jgi:hypothetical protein
MVTHRQSVGGETRIIHEHEVDVAKSQVRLDDVDHGLRLGRLCETIMINYRGSVVHEVRVTQDLMKVAHAVNLNLMRAVKTLWLGLRDKKQKPKSRTN